MKKRAGFTLFEILIAVLMVTLVFIAAISVYVSGSRMLKNAQAVDVTALPVVSLEDLTKRVWLSNEVVLRPPSGGGSSQLDLRGDQNCDAAFSPNNPPTPADTTDDNWWHYKFIGGALRMVCDNIAGTTVTAASPSVIANIDVPNSDFALNSPSGPTTPTVVNIRLQTSATPVTVLNTNAALGAKPKR